MAPAPSPRLGQRLGLAIARAAGWKIQIDEPPPVRCVIAGAPHTSNWDFLLALLFMLATGLDLRFVGKHTLFRWPFGRLMRALGGIPVDRRATENFVEQMVAAFNTRDPLRLTMAPEGTRGRATHWRTGFYYIALGAAVPIVLGYVDYGRRVMGLGPTLHPTGDIDADFEIIRAFFAGITGKHPERQGTVQARKPE
jgi:1-acyl-sn-glycerol-3-phosphate acyltransferase